MKQLTILCSSDLAGEGRAALGRAGIEGFLHVPRAVGVKPGAAAEHGRWPRWEAEMFVVPCEDAAVSRGVEGLREFTDHCDVEPCLRILVSSLEAVY